MTVTAENTKRGYKSLDEFFIEQGKKYIYGSAYSDHYLLHDPESLPRYGHLARKAMMHYVGDHYNPHRHGLIHEPFIRARIKEMIAYKILHRLKEYDWECIDHMFRKYFSRCFQLDLPYDQARIDAGFQGKAKAPLHIDWSHKH